MPRTYTVRFDNQAATASVDFFEVRPGDDRPVEIVAIKIDQSTDVTEQLRWEIIRGHTTSGSGGATPTPEPVDPTDAASGASAETMNTTVASLGTTATLVSGAFNIEAGLYEIYPPEMRPIADQGDTSIVVRLQSTPADSITFSGTLWFIER